MIYYDTLNNAELFATYAFAKPEAWDLVMERTVTHVAYGNGTIKEKDGVIFRIQFPDQLRFFCELDFFGCDFVNVQFTNISLPAKHSRDTLIDTLYSWELKKSGRFYRGSIKHYQRRVYQGAWQYQQNLVQLEYARIQQQQELMIKNAELALLRDKQPKEQIVSYEPYRSPKYAERDEK